MNIDKELEDVRDRRDLLCVAQLAIVYAEAAGQPYVSWPGYEITPAQMAVYTVKTARDRGHMYSLCQKLGVK